MMSGGPIEGFREGWAVRISFGAHRSKAHYYVREELSWADALCAIHSVRATALRGLGSWEKCQRCEAKLQKTRTRDHSNARANHMKGEA